MKNFFAVIIIVAVSIFIFVSYYASKNLYSRYRQKRINLDIQKKSYEDEKKYIRFYLRTLLNDLEAGKLTWILIFSRLNPEIKIELIYNSINNMIQLQHRIRNLTSSELNKLKKLGLHSIDTKNELSSLSVSRNSTIVTDIVYFLLEQVGEQKYAQNIRVVTSGG
jgi:hypothetical protein